MPTITFPVKTSLSFYEKNAYAQRAVVKHQNMITDAIETSALNALLHKVLVDPASKQLLDPVHFTILKETERTQLYNKNAAASSKQSFQNACKELRERYRANKHAREYTSAEILQWIKTLPGTYQRGSIKITGELIYWRMESIFIAGLHVFNVGMRLLLSEQTMSIAIYLTPQRGIQKQTPCLMLPTSLPDAANKIINSLDIGRIVPKVLTTGDFAALQKHAVLVKSVEINTGVAYVPCPKIGNNTNRINITLDNNAGNIRHRNHTTIEGNAFCNLTDDARPRVLIQGTDYYHQERLSLPEAYRLLISFREWARTHAEGAVKDYNRILNDIKTLMAEKP